MELPEEPRFNDATQSLQYELNKQYEAAERFMSLRSCNVDIVKELSVVIDQLFDQLIQAYKSTKVVDKEAFESVAENHREFNCRFKEWLKAVASTPDPVLNPAGIVAPSSGHSHKSGSPKTKSNHSSSISVTGSSRSSVKLRNAMAKFKKAQIEAKQTVERAEEESLRLQQKAKREAAEIEEESLRLQRKAKREAEEAKEESQRLKREAQRKLELASAELQVWSDITVMENDNKATLAVKSPVESFQPNKIQDQPCTSRDAQKLNFQASRRTSPTTIDYKRQFTSFEANNAFKAPVSFPSLTCTRPPVSFDLSNPNQAHVGNPLTTIASISVNAFEPERQDTPAQRVNVAYLTDKPQLNASNFQNRCATHPVFNPANNFQTLTDINHKQVTSNVHSQPATVNSSQNINPNSSNIQQVPYVFSHDDRYLPRPELTKFNGNPLEYKTFMNNFERHIVPKVRDSKILLCYLLQQCEPYVRNKLQHFSNKGDAGFHLAKARLEKEYGQPCVIADACEQQLKAARNVRFNDPEGIKCYAELLERTLATIEDINFIGSLNSLDTMTQLVNKLPHK